MTVDPTDVAAAAGTVLVGAVLVIAFALVLAAPAASRQLLLLIGLAAIPAAFAAEALGRTMG